MASGIQVTSLDILAKKSLGIELGELLLTNINAAVERVIK